MTPSRRGKHYLTVDHLGRYDFRHKKIAVIGGGSSSIQIVPELQKIDGTRVSVFTRQKTWITNRFGDQIMGQMGWDPTQLDSKPFVLSHQPWEIKPRTTIACVCH